MKAYIASGWFTVDQDRIRKQLIEALTKAGIDFYSPKEDFLYEPGKTNPKEVFDINLLEIIRSDFILANTVGKDLGTIFECGYAYRSKIPIVYYWKSSFKLNLMLAQSAAYVSTDELDLFNYLLLIKKEGKIIHREYTGLME